MQGTIERISQIGINVRDIDRAIEFYKSNLGLELQFHTENMAFLECGEIRLLLSLPEKEEFDHKSSVLYFHVDDIKEAYQNMVENGVSFRGEPHAVAKMETTETWLVFFNDTEGNTHALTSEIEG
ncbi:VOC family protein [Halobacillus massiliensis]|uniref:VOC family protein n=1 Tax=Halobacillus massiliensis TaxID=1926286 RepID=UPI0009E26099|nr:VOC family protein [Halobacillus massiliensis]